MAKHLKSCIKGPDRSKLSHTIVKDCISLSANCTSKFQVSSFNSERGSRILSSVANLKYGLVLLIYSAGLRVGEVVRLGDDIRHRRKVNLYKGERQ